MESNNSKRYNINKKPTKFGDYIFCLTKCVILSNMEVQKLLHKTVHGYYGDLITPLVSSLPITLYFSMIIRSPLI